MNGDAISLAAFIAAALVPFAIVLRWNGAGFVFAVLFGWAVVYGANLIVPRREPVDAVFVGVCVAIGWAYMIAWCLLCAACVAMVRFFFPGRDRPAI